MGGAYGGGGAGGGHYAEDLEAGGRYDGLAGGERGGAGAVRIIWPGNTRQFPSTNTGDV
jgi:hypothetical protein